MTLAGQRNIGLTSKQACKPILGRQKRKKRN